MFFSISIPIYNAERYLDRCIESIMNQEEKDFELILVDDGSSDSSEEICSNWLEKYPDQIRFFRNENQGSLLTRRKCLEESRGDYCYIIDADDMLINHKALGEIKKIIIEEKCDLCFFNCCADNSGKKYLNLFFRDREIFTGKKLQILYRQILTTDSFNQLWNKVFSRDLVDWDTDYNNFKYLSNGTDLFQCIPILNKAQKVVYLDRIYYSYTLNNNNSSIIHSFNPMIYKSLKANFFRLEHFSHQWNFAENERTALLKCKYMHIVSSVIYKARLIDNIHDKLKFIKYVGVDPDFHKYYSLNNLSFSRRLIVFLLKKQRFRLLCFLLNLISG